MFGENKAKPTDYSGGRTADEIVAAALDATRSVASKRLGKPLKAGADPDSKFVVKANDDNFDEVVMGAKEVRAARAACVVCCHTRVADGAVFCVFRRFLLSVRVFIASACVLCCLWSLGAGNLHACFFTHSCIHRATAARAPRSPCLSSSTLPGAVTASTSRPSGRPPRSSSRGR